VTSNKKGTFLSFLREHYALYILFWPIHSFLWFASEKLAVGRAFIIHCPLDDAIPFCEYFIVFYYLWYPFWIGMLFYLFLKEPEAFKKASQYLIMMFLFCDIMFFFIPTAIDFQPETFANDNIFTRLTKGLYDIDEPTNVCPSEHVIGAIAVIFIALDTKKFRSAKWMIPIVILAILISLSILFVKQHSVWDLVAALPFCVLCRLICYRPWRNRNKIKE
jgi:hypothetical protein